MSTHPDTPRAAIYARISRDKRGEQLGVDRQREKAIALADLKGFTVDDRHIFTDNDTSAFSGVARPGYTALCQAIAEGEVDAVVVWHTDRLHRRTRELLDYMDLCRRRGVVTYAVQGAPLNPTSGDGKLIATVMSAVAEQESAHKAERITAAFEQRARLGRPRRDGRRTFGYEQDGETLREVEADALRRAARELLDGRSLRAIVKDLNDAGLTSTGGRPLTTQAVRETLTTPYIAGLSSWNPQDDNGRRLRKNRQIVGRGSWPAILDEDTYTAVAALLSNPARKTNTAGNTPRHLLSGIATCGICGGPMYCRTRKYPNGKRVRYYYCKGRGDEGTSSAGHPSRTADAVDDFIVELTLRRLERGDVLAAIARAGADNDQGEVDRLTADRDAKRRTLDDLEEQVVSGTIDAATFGRVNARISEQVDAINAELARLAQVDDAALTVLDGVVDVRAWWEGAELLDRRRVVAALLDVAVLPGTKGVKHFEPDKLRVTWRV